MNPAKKEALRRFGINVGVIVLVGGVFMTIGYFAKPILDANPQHPIGPILLVGFLLAMVGQFAIYFYVSKMRSRCPHCGKTTATMVKKPSNDIYLECKECGYAENTDWRSDDPSVS